MAMDRDGDGPPLRREDAKPRAVGRDELRATAFTDDVFDDDYYGRRKRSGGSGGGRATGLIIGAVLGVAVVAGGGWYVFNNGGMSLKTGDPQIVRADSTPYKIKPENPGGMQVDNQDKLVYDRVAKGSAPSRVENLLPPVEEPKAPPQKAKADAVTAPAAPPAPASAPGKVTPADEKALQAMVKAADEPLKPAAPTPAPVQTAAATPAPAPAAVPSAPPPAPAAAPKVDPLVAAVAAAANKPVEVAPAATPDTAPKSSEPVQTASATPIPMPAGAFQVQLASAPSEDAANAEWKRITNRHKDLFGGLSPTVTKADLGERGTVYRLRAGPLPDKMAATTLCEALVAAEKTGCIVVKP